MTTRSELPKIRTQALKMLPIFFLKRYNGLLSEEMFIVFFSYGPAEIRKHI